MDAVLFSMFARSTAFDHLLDAPLPKPEQQRVQRALLEVVARLRRSELVPAELMHHVRWCTATACKVPPLQRLSAQQDASEFFLALLDVLHAPVLPLRILLMHGGATTAGDDQFISERMIELGALHALGRPASPRSAPRSVVVSMSEPRCA